MGTQCWVYCAIMFCEGILCIKNGRELFSQTHATKVVFWLAIQAALSILFVTACVFWHRFVEVRKIIAAHAISHSNDSDSFRNPKRLPQSRKRSINPAEYCYPRLLSSKMNFY